MELPKQKVDQGHEDIESIDDNIGTLYEKFIAPIDRLRSFAESPEGKLTKEVRKGGIPDLKVDPINPLESRAHAFYRMLGLPVVSGTNYYNPGFNPLPQQTINKDTINSSLSSEDLSRMELRELHHKLFSQMYSIKNLSSTVFAYAQAFGCKSFNMLDSDKNTKEISERKDALEKTIPDLFPLLVEDIKQAISDFQVLITYSPTSVRHIIKPLMVNPMIDFTVMPSDHKVCVPFLPDKKSTRISAEPDVFLLRPGLEFIIRSRLKDNKADPNFLTYVKNIIKQETSPSPSFKSNADTQAIKQTILALVDTNKISSSDVNDVFESFSNTQVTVVLQLVQTIKVVVKMLHDSIKDFWQTSTEISFLPVANEKGFEFGGSLKSAPPSTQLEKNLIALQLKQAKAQKDLQTNTELGGFAMSGFINLEKVESYGEQIEQLTQSRRQYGNKGLNAIKNIEIITGEGSGFGLIDILAIYTALWSIPMGDLLALLDKDAFERLYTYNSNLTSSEIETRKNGGGPSITQALKTLEDKMSNILSFADLLFTKVFTSINNDNGDPT